MVGLIWATRGRTWGFRFLLTGAYPDPLAVYERAFAGTHGESVVCRRSGDGVALRFPDPLARTDSAGRIIPHDFVVPETMADDIDSVEDGLQKVWPVVSAHYSEIWNSSEPPETAG